MSYVTINAKTDPKLKARASELADELGISLIIVINTALRNFVAERKLVVSEDYVPDRFIRDTIVEAETDLRQGRSTTTSTKSDINALVDSL